MTAVYLTLRVSPQTVELEQILLQIVALPGMVQSEVTEQGFDM